MKNTAKYSVIAIFVALTLIIVAIIFYARQFGLSLSNRQEIWAWFGDYVSGVVGVSLAFISFIALLYTIVLQSEELRQTRKELKRTRIAQEASIDYTRLNALLVFRTHYIDLMANEGKKMKMLKGTKAETLLFESYADLDTKLRQVNTEIENYHEKVVGNKI